MAPLKITLFASLQVAVNGRSVTDFATDKARALLVYLVMERHQPHRRETLAALLWPDQPEARARQSLRQALSNLRQALGDSDESPTPFLLIDRNEVQFNPQAELWLDAAEFTALASACDRHRHRQAAQCLPCLRRMEAMLALYTGDFLAGFSFAGGGPFEEWVLLKREWLHIRAIEALVQLADFYERRGEYAAARRFAQQQVRLEPWREEAYRQLMRLLFYEGQRSAALAQYESCRRALARELGVEPTSETVRLYTTIREADELPAAAKPAVTGLPAAVTQFIGRVAECAELAEMLADPDGRLITLTGPGGVGKSRLAMRVAEAQVGLYPDGVFWVSLAAIQTAELIIPTIAQAVDLKLYGKEPPEAQLLAYLREKRLLLVLDNVEHLPAAGEITAVLLQGAPKLVLLVTSRERLALREEQLYAVEGLAYTAAASTSTTNYEAAQLFIHCVQRTYRKFAPSAADLTAVADICRLVEGMPLALELAAAWVPDQDCAAVARALAVDMEMLTSSLRNVPERQRSVWATFEHSWELLPEDEQLLFARLSVFRGGFARCAAAQVADLDSAGLARLAAKSLVRQVGNGRYLLHELLRQFAALKLAAFPGQTDTTAARHAAYYLTFLAGQEASLKGTGQEAALAAVDQELANIHQAWDWTVTEVAARQSASAAGLLHHALEAVSVFYALRSWYQEGAALFARAVTAVTPALPPHQLLSGELLARQARCREFTAPPQEAVALYRESLARFQSVAAERETALPLYGLGYMAHIQGDYEASRRYLLASLVQYRASGDDWGMANVQSSLCLTLRRQGAFAEAAQAGRESLQIRRKIGDRRGIASSQNNLGLIYCALGEFGVAEEALQESVTICREIGHTVGTANALTGLCHVFVNAKAYDRAASVQREAQALFQEVGDLWGVAIAYNNLGQIALEDSQPIQAQALLEQAVNIYRELGIKSSLAHTLSNLAKTSYELGNVTAAVRYVREGMAVAAEIGDRPIALELLTTMAVIAARQANNGRSLVIMAFALQQPELFAETRETAVTHYAAMQTQFGSKAAATAESEAGRLDFQTITAEAIAMLP